MTHRDIEDGMGFGGLVESPEERRARRNNGGMSKFAAAAIYDQGVRYAMFRDTPAGGFPDTSGNPLWKFGYQFGMKIRKQFLDERTSSLRAMDIEPIQEMRLQ
jgi:hypothetical protein